MFVKMGLTEKCFDKLAEIYKVAGIRLEKGKGVDGTYVIVNEDTGEDLLIQSDWDYPGVASTFGWPGIDEDEEIQKYLKEAYEYMTDVDYKGENGYIYFDNGWYFVPEEPVDYNAVDYTNPVEFEEYLKSLGIAKPMELKGSNFDKLDTLDEISAARRYLDDHIGEVAEDPGYFE